MWAAVGLVIGRESLTVNSAPGLPETMTIAAGITGLIAFAMSYFFAWDNGSDD
ncbi:hypothetical protein ACFZC5_35065 [Nocardia gamkensis]|uniref:hypothetical protein n=1 Tax=Nocardia gamkensis TaxID=352869 RepID=UPI0036E691DA